MASSATLVSVVKEAAPSTRILFNFSDGMQREYASLLEVQGEVADFDSNHEGFCRMTLIARAVRLSADLSNTAQVVGKTATLDVTQTTVLRIA
jgi:hypothetical protein